MNIKKIVMLVALLIVATLSWAYFLAATSYLAPLLQRYFELPPSLRSLAFGAVANGIIGSHAIEAFAVGLVSTYLFGRVRNSKLTFMESIINFK